MKPLHTDVEMTRQPLRQAHALLEDKNWMAADPLLEDFARSSSIEPDSPERGEWCILKARALSLAGEFREAVRLAREGLSIYRLTSQDRELAEAHCVLGAAYLGQGETKTARVHVRDALAIHRRLGDDAGMMRASNDLAHILFVRGEYDLAVEQIKDAIGLAERLGEDAKQISFQGNLGRIHLLRGEWDSAEIALRVAYERARDAGSSVSMARNSLSLAYLGILRHQFDEASHRLDESLALIAQANLARERAIHFEYLGWWHFEQQHWIQAKEAFRGALEIGRKMSDESDLVSQSLRGLAECEAALEDWSEARRLAEDGLAVALEIDERAEVGCFYRLLALVHAHQGNSTEASTSLNRAHEILKVVGDPYEIARLEMAQARLAPHLEFMSREDGLAALRRAVESFGRLGANAQRLDACRWLVDMYRGAGQLDEAMAVARQLLDGEPDSASPPEEMIGLLDSLSQDCVLRSQSPDNQFRLGGMPWIASETDETSDELQHAVEFYRARINASRVLLIEVTVEGERSGRVIAQSGADDDSARSIGEFVANAYQRDLPTDSPRFIWSLAGRPALAAHLAAGNGHPPTAVVSIPVELGPAASGLLYADVTKDEDSQGVGFQPSDIDFSVAFAEVIAWRSTKLRSEGLLRDVQRLRGQLGQASDFPSIITQDAAFRDTLSRVHMVIDADVSVLLDGETGTGKDLLARAIHYAGRRRDRRFISVNCAALPETLLESELFGVRRGAFTGADRDKAGLFEEADGGTFFLDEIGEMPLTVQVKLLRVLESKEVVRLGDTKPRSVDVRVVSATNRDLGAEMERGTFRRDLFYRLSPLVFTLPPLRERREDIPILIDHFLETIAAESKRTVRLSGDALRAMCAYHWPGNVRELENEMRKIVLLSENGAEVGAESLSRKFTEHVVVDDPQADKPLPDRFSLYDHVAQIERVFIVRALNDAAGVKKHAAGRLGIPESTLRLKMKQYDIGHP